MHQTLNEVKDGLYSHAEISKNNEIAKISIPMISENSVELKEKVFNSSEISAEQNFSKNSCDSLNSLFASYEQYNEIYDKHTSFHLTEEQKKCVLRLKETFERETKTLKLFLDDTFFLRFASIKKYEYNKAEAMINAYLKWRCEFKIDFVILKERYTFSNEIKKYYPHGYFGVDKLGQPIYIERLGQLNISKVFSITSFDNILQYYVQQYEYLLQVIFPSCSIHRGERIKQNFTILDLEGLGWSHFGNQARSIVTKLTSLGHNYYPNTLGKMFIINCPAIFKMIWNFVKPLLDENTISRISIYSRSDPWQEKLLEFIDAEQLPELFGGTRKCEKDFFNQPFGPWCDVEVIRKLWKFRPSIPLNLFYLSFPDAKNEAELMSILEKN